MFNHTKIKALEQTIKELTEQVNQKDIKIANLEYEKEQMIKDYQRRSITSISYSPPKTTKQKKGSKQPVERILDELVEIREILEECCDMREDPDGTDKEQEKDLRQEPKRRNYRSPLM